MLWGQPLKEVESFSYLCSEINQSNKAEKEVLVRLEKAGKAYQIWRRKVFQSRTLSIATKVHAHQTLVMPVLLYGAETWTETQQYIRKLKSSQMRCLQDILGITLWNRVRNTDIRERTGVLPVEEQLRQRFLQWLYRPRLQDAYRMPQKTADEVQAQWQEKTNWRCATIYTLV